MIKAFKKISQCDWLIIGLIFLIGLGLRLYPGKDHWSWIYDQARDSYVIQSIIQDRNLVLIGPQTDYPGLNHGPISYYFLAPFYFLSGGDPNLPGLAMIFLNLSTLIPLGLLVQALFKDRRVTLLSLFLFSISYEVIEYARWIFNFSVSIPLLVWSYYFLWESLLVKTEKYQNLLAGLFLGLAIQGELYLLYLVPFFLGFYYFSQKKISAYLKLFKGLTLGLLPLIIAEIKFVFFGTNTFINDFLLSHQQPLEAGKSVLMYLDHLGATTKHTLFGISYPMGLLFFVGLVISVFVIRSQVKKSHKKAMTFVLVLLFSHSILFTFYAPNKVFLDLPLHIPLLILTAFVLVKLWQLKWQLFTIIILTLIVFFSLTQTYKNTRNKTPFELFNFIQTGMLFSQKMELVKAMYQLTEGQSFSMTVLGTPYGVQTVWASVFQQYQRRYPQVSLPTWYGERALGYPADQTFAKVDAPADFHIFMIEPNQTLISQYIRSEVLAKQNSETILVKQIELYGYQLQLRTPTEQSVLK